MDLIERFLNYVGIDTASDETSDTCPSTKRQFDLAYTLERELNELGASDVRVDEHGYVYAAIPANRDGQPVIGLIAHMDVVNSVKSSGIRPRLLRYEGSDIVLNEEQGIVMRESEFDALSGLHGHELIVTDGTTLLGGDDKAGIAEIMQLAEYLTSHPEFPHGRVMIGFTPDEEIGRGADLFDVRGFGADFAYTLDGDKAGGIEYENFNAAALTVTVHGRSIHPGSAKNKLRHAAKIAMEYQSMLPVRETPENTEGYEGFFHLISISGNEELATMTYIIRDHDAEKFDIKKARAKKIADYLNDKYGVGTVEAQVRDQYRNMKEIIEQNPQVIERAREAVKAAGLTPFSKPVRGGTDGATLCYMGLPCPNLGTGGGNFHGNYEYVSATEMRQMVEVLKALVKAQ